MWCLLEFKVLMPHLLGGQARSVNTPTPPLFTLFPLGLWIEFLIGGEELTKLISLQRILLRHFEKWEMLTSGNQGVKFFL